MVKIGDLGRFLAISRRFWSFFRFSPDSITFFWDELEPSIVAQNDRQTELYGGVSSTKPISGFVFEKSPKNLFLPPKMGGGTGFQVGVGLKS